jgi:uncharacterized protein (DUF488 family)
VNTVATVGYEYRTVDDLIEDLIKARVKTLVDVCLTPISRKTGLSKHRLAFRLQRVGIDYLHLPQLGNPRDNRAAFRRRDADAVARYLAVLKALEARTALAQLVDLTQRHDIALMCFEQNASECHRALVADALVEMNPCLTVTQL